MQKKRIQFISGEHVSYKDPNRKLTKREQLINKGLLHTGVEHAKCRNISHDE